MNRNHENKHMKISAVIIVIMGFLLFSSCASLPEAGREKYFSLPKAGRNNGSSPPLSGLQMKLVEGSSQILGATSLTINGKTFPMDCTGAVMAIYWYAGIDLARDFGKYQGNGVTRLYRFLEKERLVSDKDDPVPGDILFWDNTYDANEDGRFNDDFTHVGMVVNILEGGTVEYVHLNYRRGIVLERMNLMDPDSRSIKVDGYEILINSPIRARNSPPAPGDVSLASQLLRARGLGWKL